MKQIRKPVISHLSVKNPDDVRTEGNNIKKPMSKLGRIQKDRSFLPSSIDQPVHKCGCT